MVWVSLSSSYWSLLSLLDTSLSCLFSNVGTFQSLFLHIFSLFFLTLMMYMSFHLMMSLRLHGLSAFLHPFFFLLLSLCNFHGLMFTDSCANSNMSLNFSNELFYLNHYTFVLQNFFLVFLKAFYLLVDVSVLFTHHFIAFLHSSFNSLSILRTVLFFF